ncbi:MAG: ammonia-forming cytochrome c nitrite reductase subunit c552 [Planctomycetia bacterium]
MTSRPLLLLAALGLLALPTWLGLARGGEEPAPAPQPVAPAAAPAVGAAGAFAGSEACAGCHGEVHARWAASTHALTVRPARADSMAPEALAGLEVEHGPGRTRFVREGEAFWARTLGPDGQPARFPVTHVVGRTRIEMLLTRLPDGRRQVLPAMREHGTGTWFDYTALYFAGPGGDRAVPPAVAPGEPSFWTGPVRSWDAQCSRCHLSGREAVAEPSVGAERTRQRAWGLDCESCHGPGAAHVRHHEGTAEGPDPVLRLRTLSRREQVDTCLACHMEAEEIAPGWQPGRGVDLLEHLDPSLLDDPDRVDPAGRPLELVYAGVSFWSSRCAQQGELTCQSCHDPHGGEHRGAMRGPPRDDAQCASCHGAIVAQGAAHSHHPAGAGGVRCVDCHMPLLTVERGHGAVTDHTIGVPRPGLVSDRVAQDACTWCHAGGRGAPPGAPPLSEQGVRTAHGRWWPQARPAPAWLEAIAAARRRAFDGPSRLLALLADREAPRLARATAPTLLARYAREAGQPVLAYAQDPDSLVRRRVAPLLASDPRPEAWAALGTLLGDASAPVRAAASRAALGAAARLQPDAALLARVRAELAAQAAAVPDDDLRWARLADACALAGDAAGEREAVERWALLDPGNAQVEARRARLALPPAGLPGPR